MIWSSKEESTAPATVSRLPSAFTMTSAGWNATSNRENTSPGSSLIWGKVRPCLSTKPWYESSEPVHATPTKLTWSWYLMLAASTEGASRLHVLQVGDQNQNAVGFPDSSAASSSPPPTRVPVNWRISGASPDGVSDSTPGSLASADASGEDSGGEDSGGAVSGLSSAAVAAESDAASEPSELPPQATPTRPAASTNALRRNERREAMWAGYRRSPTRARPCGTVSGVFIVRRLAPA